MGDVDLEQFACVQIAYEVRTMFGQVVELLQRPREPWDPVYLALVEAPLVHLRALDDFLGATAAAVKKRGHDDVVAQHYLPEWEPQPFLDDDVRKAINAQLQHLAERRETGYDWYFPIMCSQFIDEFTAFTDDLAAADRDEERSRVEWFAEPIAICRIARALSDDDIDGLFSAHGS